MSYRDRLTPDDEQVRLLARSEMILERLEPLVVELARTAARQSDIQDMHREIADLRARVTETAGRIVGLPTQWMLLIALFAIWGAGAGLAKTLVG